MQTITQCAPHPIAQLVACALADCCSGAFRYDEKLWDNPLGTETSNGQAQPVNQMIVNSMWIDISDAGETQFPWECCSRCQEEPDCRGFNVEHSKGERGRCTFYVLPDHGVTGNTYYGW